MDVHNYKLTPRGLKILKMDTLRLNDYLNQVMLENPVIEIEENLTGYTDEDLRARKAEWLESNDFEEGLSYFDKETELPQAEEPDYAMLNAKDGETLEQHLLAQIAELPLSEQVRNAASYLIHHRTYAAGGTLRTDKRPDILDLLYFLLPSEHESVWYAVFSFRILPQ